MPPKSFKPALRSSWVVSGLRLGGDWRLMASGSRTLARARVSRSASRSGSTWFAMRCFYATEEGRPRFAHTAPWHIDIAGRPLRPRQREVAYLKERVESALARTLLLVGPEAVAEYEQALARYEEIAETAR